MKASLLIALASVSATLLASGPVFAGQENNGGANYGTEIASCDGDALNIAVYHNVAAGFFTALVTTRPGTEATPFGVREILPPPHVVGGGRHYNGKGFELSICTDCGSLNGMPGSAKVPSLKIDQSVHCQLH